jgi:hypothetical protein
VARALALLDKTECGRVPVRLLGVSVHNFSETPDLPEKPKARAKNELQPSLPFD